MIRQLTSRDFDEVVRDAELPVLVEFWAPWCGPCRMLAGVMEDIAREYEDRLLVVGVNIDGYPDIAGRYGVASVPTVVAFVDGTECDRTVGYRPKAAFLNVIEQLI